MGRIDWEKHNKKSRPNEEKYDDGKVLSNGRVVSHKKDSLARRAAYVERQWLKKIGKDKI